MKITNYTENCNAFNIFLFCDVVNNELLASSKIDR